jgi:hypothetical protein
VSQRAGPDSASEKRRLSAARAQAALANPTEWYVADDPATTTRFFVIQGSDNLDHWRVNLTFDPVAFEDASLGVKARAPRGRMRACPACWRCIM